MIQYDESSITLSGETAAAFMRSLLHPDPEVVRARERYRQVLDRITIQRTERGFSVDIPDLVIPEKPVVMEYSCTERDCRELAPKYQKLSFVVYTLGTATMSAREYFSPPAKAGTIYHVAKETELLLGPPDAA